MPLIKGKSDKAFKKNIKTEYEEGKPLKQSLAIAYAMKRKAKKMAGGGPVLPGAQSAQDSLRKAFKFAKGGDVKGVHTSDMEMEHPKNKMEKYWAGESQAGAGIRNADLNDSNMQKAYSKHGKVIAELKSMKKPDIKGLAFGGELESGYHDMPEEHELMNHAAMTEDDKDLNQHMVDMQASTDMSEQDLVDRIMMKRSMDLSGDSRNYSEGGRVANETPITAGFKPNEFDDLVLRDDLESTYGDDDNAGDMLGNEQQDEDRKDIVARIMASRRKKDRLPNPR